MAQVAVLFIKFYQMFISKYIFTGRKCRFYPTCSQYSIDAYEKYGFAKGTCLSVRRILKCHPFNVGGYDPLK